MIPLAVLIALMGMGSAEVTLPSYYFDGMVFQGDVSDNLIWGFTDNPDVEVLVEVGGRLPSHLLQSARSDLVVRPPLCSFLLLPENIGRVSGGR